jgi:putative transposase
MPKGKSYPGEFKQTVMEDVYKNRLSFKEAARKYEISDRQVRDWDRIYLQEGMEGFYKGTVGKIAPNILCRNFNAVKPNMKWVTDITEISLLGQKLYLSPILDLYNDEIISYNISCRPIFSQVTDMLNKAFEKIPDNTNLILHSDQGWQYQMKVYQQALAKKGIRQSMSRKGNCLDNAVMENFFGLLKTELLYLQKFDSIEQFIRELHDYIDYYNNRRIKAKLKGMSPVNYRTHSKKIA